MNNKDKLVTTYTGNGTSQVFNIPQAVKGKSLIIVIKKLEEVRK